MAPLRAAALQAASVLSRRPATLFWPRLAVRAAIAAVAGAKAGDRRRPTPRSARQACRMDGAPHRDSGFGVVDFRQVHGPTNTHALLVALRLPLRRQILGVCDLFRR